MSRVSTYLNFKGTAEEAFLFYRSVFGTEFAGPVLRMSDGPTEPGMPAPSESEKNLIMHIELPILAGHVLMASDVLDSMGHELRVGNNTTLNLEVESRDEADRLFAGLGDGATETFGLEDMAWGSYWGTFLDKFGVRWMINCPISASA